MPRLATLGVNAARNFGLFCAPTYAFGSIPSSINEGGSGTFNVTTTNITSGTVLYWYINNSTTSSGDFSATSGSFTITGNAGSFTVSPAADHLSESSETFTVSISRTNLGTAVATSGSVTVVNQAYYSLNTSPSISILSLAAANSISITHSTWDPGSAAGTASSFYYSTDQTNWTSTSSTTYTTSSSDNGRYFKLLETDPDGINSTYSNVIGPVAIPTYSVSAAGAATSVNEGSSLTFNVTTTNVANSTTLYWTIDTNAGDFGTSSGSFTITSNAGSFSVTPTADATTEGPETFTVSVRTGSTSGTVVATSSSITINDTSLTPTISSVTGANANEGSSASFSVVTANIANGTTMSWSINHITTSSADFTATSGTFTITSNAGSFSIGIVADGTTEGPETYTVTVSGGSASSLVSSSYTVNDTSVTTYTVSAAGGATSVNEGSSLTFNVGGTGITNGTYYWTVDTNAGDFGTSSGSFTISSNTGSFSVTPTADLTTEGAETFTVSVRSGSTSGTILVTSSSITINDTSTTPPTYSFGSIPSSISEGSSGTFNVTTTNVTNGTTLYWYINNTTTSSGDFSATSGSFTITSNTGSFTVSPAADHLSESGETFTVSISLTNLGTALATSSSVTVNNVAYYSLNTSPSISISSLAAANSISITHSTWNPGSAAGTASSFYYSTDQTNWTSTSSTTYTTSSSDNGRYFKLLETDPDGVNSQYSNVIGPVAIPTYSVSAASGSVNEGSSLTFNVTTTNVANSTTLYWTINNTTTSNADFSATSGSFTITSNTGSFSISIVADATTEGNETFTVSVRTGSTGGTVVATSGSVTVNDTSTSPPTYSFGSIPSSILEGGSGTFNVTTTNVTNGTTLYWYINNSTTSSGDFSATSGSFTITSNAGSFTVSAVADHLGESSETFTVSISLTNLGTALATSDPVTVTNQAYYTLSSSPSISISSLAAANSISVTKAVWSPGSATSPSSYGQFFYSTNGVSGFTAMGVYTYTTSSADNGRYFRFRDQDPDGVSIIESNVIGPVAIPVISSVTGANANEGASASFSVVTANIANGTTMSWSINHITTSSADFTATSGTFTISSNAGSFSIGLVADHATEGGETYTVTVSGGSASSLTSSSYTINDTSPEPSISGYWSPSSLSFPSNRTATFYWSISNYVGNETISVSVSDGGNTPSLYDNSSLTGSSGNTGALTFNNSGTGYAYAFITNYMKNTTVPITIAPPAGISVNNYPTLATHGTGFSYTITGGYPSETWTATWSGAFSGSYSSSLNSSGAYDNGGTGDFGTNYGTVTVTWSFSRSSQTPSKTITNQPPTPSVSYPSSSPANTPFSWSISGGLSGESWSVTWTGANSGTYGPTTLDSSGAASFTGSQFPNTGTTNLTWTFNSSYRVNTQYVYKTITIT